MWPYWLMFLVPAWAVVQPGRLRRTQVWLPWGLVFLLYSLMIGFRYEVGGDWFNYLAQFNYYGSSSIGEVFERGDAGYYGLNWLVYRLGGEIYWVNLVCAVLLVWGAIVFSRAQPNPWLAMLAAVPYMLIVVGMGYTRQSAALGCALLGLTALGQGRVRKFVLWVALGALFHKTAVLLMPIAALAASRNRLLTAFLVIAASVLFYYLLLADSSESLWVNYVVSQYQSEGAGSALR
ncbi:EpsG family protein [Thermomonas sp. S9]|uniref:EpsG family protein n=1 Tax=Thermomonas sp. S9 TaxID=2885203 RepID=UPI00216B2D3E|nr:EpsG family protein [Thermomonas sp. S9]